MCLALRLLVKLKIFYNLERMAPKFLESEMEKQLNRPLCNNIYSKESDITTTKKIPNKNTDLLFGIFTI